MKDTVEISHMGLVITVVAANSKFRAIISNGPHSFEDLSSVKPIEGLPSVEQAVAAGKKFIENHLWRPVFSESIFTVYIRNWWDGDWSYGIGCGSPSETLNGFAGYESALEAAKVRLKNKMKDLEDMSAVYRQK